MTRSLLIAAAVSFIAVAALSILNFIAQGVDQDRYRAAIATAVADGTMSRIEHPPFGPPKDVRIHGGNDCLVLSMLLMPRVTPLEASLSPRLPNIADSAPPSVTSRTGTRGGARSAHEGGPFRNAGDRRGRRLLSSLLARLLDSMRCCWRPSRSRP